MVTRFLRWYLGGLAKLAEERAEQKRAEVARIRGGVAKLNIVHDREIIRGELLRANQMDALANWWQALAELVPGRWQRRAG